MTPATMDARTAARQALKNYSVKEIRFKVVRETTAARLRLSQPEAVASFIEQSGLIPDDAREHFLMLMLDSQNGVVATHAVSVGTLSSSLVAPREVFGPALRVMGCGSIILVHNHPSGDPTPSGEDLRLTRRLAEGAKLLDLRIHDHVILGNGSGQWVSLAQRGVL